MTDNLEKRESGILDAMEYKALIHALAKKAARDHMRNNANTNNTLQVLRTKRVDLRPLPPAA